MSKRKTTEEFIEQARRVHGSKYDYSTVEYINTHTKVCVVCPEHGNFWIEPNSHLRGYGCPKCSWTSRVWDKEDFTKRANIVHNNKYTYEKVNYKNLGGFVIITCPLHGDFTQNAGSHLYGCGCPECAKERTPFNEFVKRANIVHNNKYIYLNEGYKNQGSKIKIICPEHGQYIQRASQHLSGNGCPECAKIVIKEKISLTNEDFIQRAKIIHNDKYIYDETSYINNYTKIKIKCKKHGLFEQTPSLHLLGAGCPICNISKLEQEVYTFLNENTIQFEQHKTFNWLKHKSNLFLDFYIEKYKVAIECQGLQHFKAVSFGHKNTKETLEDGIKRDNIKRMLCESNGIRVLYYSNLHIEYPYEVFEDKEELLKEILNKK